MMSVVALSLAPSVSAQEPRVGVVTNVEGMATVARVARSILTTTEAPGISTVELTSGRIAVAVSKAKMQPGEIVEIRTPNAVTAVRSTVVIAEVWPDTALRSTITCCVGWWT